jgi:poly-beta-1,6-N-acetyl-D-glucosamine synthase
MDWMEVLYWTSVGIVVYAYAGYPLILAALAKLRSRPVRGSEGASERLPSVSIVLPARNEEESIARRVQEFQSWISEAGLTGEIVVVSDGSTDATAAIAREYEGGVVPLQVIDLVANVGKASALTAGCLAAKNEILVLADARQVWAEDALVRLLENFGDPEVGGVGGELIIESTPGVMAGVGLYWRYETWLRRREGAIHSTVGVSGSISAVRRSLFPEIPAGTILDDVYWPLVIAMRGRRVVFDARARAFDRLPDDVGSEFRRKVRTLSGNFQLIARLPASLLPTRNPIWFALVSHKLMRLAVPWALLAAMVLSARLGGSLYGGLLAAQVIVVLTGLAGLAPGVAARSRMASALGSFLVLNAAAWVAFWVWISGRSSSTWTKTIYRTDASPSPAPAFERAVR